MRPEAGSAPPPGKGPRFSYRPLLKGEVRFDDVLVNMPTIPEFGEGESNIGLDVQITLGPKIHLYNKYLYDLWLAGGLHIQGSTLYTNISGTISADRVRSVICAHNLKFALLLLPGLYLEAFCLR